jgi:hypothetical protein
MIINRLKTVAASCLFLLFASCVFPRHSLPSYSSLTPETYCPGDTLTASFSFNNGRACPAGVDCIPFHPTVTMSAMPALFPTQSITGYEGAINFNVNSESSVAVTNASSATSVIVPNMDSTGLITASGYVSPQVKTARLYDGSEQTFNHAGMCAGASATYSGGEFRAAPRFSARLQANEMCNRSSVPIAALVFDNMGRSVELLLGNNECRSIAAPGVIFGTPVRFSVRPQVPDPTASCTATASTPPSMALATAARYACRP